MPEIEYVYALPVEKAIEKIDEHFQAVKKELPKGTPLHQVSMIDLIHALSRAIQKHPDFSTAKTFALAKKENKPLYAPSDLGHKIIIERIVSQLIAEKAIQEKHAVLLKKAIGRLYYRVPRKIKQEQEKAFKELVKQLGENETIGIFLKAGKIFEDHHQEYKKACDELKYEGFEKLKVYPEIMFNYQPSLLTLNSKPETYKDFEYLKWIALEQKPIGDTEKHYPPK